MTTTRLDLLAPEYIDNNNGSIDPTMYWSNNGGSTVWSDANDATFVRSQMVWSPGPPVTVLGPLTHIPDTGLIPLSDGVDPSTVVVDAMRCKGRIAVTAWDLADPPCLTLSTRDAFTWSLPLNHDNTAIQAYEWDLVALYPFWPGTDPRTGMAYRFTGYLSSSPDTTVFLTRQTATFPNDTGNTEMTVHELGLEIDWHFLVDTPPPPVSFEANLSADVGPVNQAFKARA